MLKLNQSEKILISFVNALIEKPSIETMNELSVALKEAEEDDSVSDMIYIKAEDVLMITHDYFNELKHITSFISNNSD